MIDFCVVLLPGKPLEFRSLDRRSGAFFDAHPEISGVVRAMSAIYRKESKDACTVIAIAKDLEAALRIVTRTSDLTVKPMRYETRETGQMVPNREKKLVEIVDDRPTTPAGR